MSTASVTNAARLEQECQAVRCSFPAPLFSGKDLGGGLFWSLVRGGFLPYPADTSHQARNARQLPRSRARSLERRGQTAGWRPLSSDAFV
jgi:hypothetical protein